MNQYEALTLAVEMLERVAPGRNFGTRAFYEQLSDIKRTIEPVSPSSVAWPRTAIVDGEEFYEICQQTIGGKNLVLLESSRDGGEAPAIIVDADTREVVMDEVYNGFQDYLEERVVKG
jgi:hypothetical protein